MNSLSALQTKETNLKNKIARLSKSNDANKDEALARAQSGLAEVQDAMRGHPEKTAATTTTKNDKSK